MIVLPTLKGHFLSNCARVFFCLQNTLTLMIADGTPSKSPLKQMQTSYRQYAGATLRDRILIWARGQRKQERSNMTFEYTWNTFQAVIFPHRCTTVTTVTPRRLFISTSEEHWCRQKRIHKACVRVCGHDVRLTFTLVPIRRSLQSPYKVLQFYRPIICSNLLPH